MAEIVLSIKPEFVTKIIKGEKQFEFRKRLCQRDIEKIYLYATHPIKKVLAEVEVAGKLKCDKELLWEKTKHLSGIEKEYFDKYFINQEKAGAYCLGKVTVYKIGKELEELGLVSAPQSFAYAKKSSCDKDM